MSIAMMRMFAFTLLLAFGSPTLANQAAPAKPMTLGFGGVQYVHRWSQKGQNEFTPPAETDLAKWRDMVTINLHDEVHDGDQLAALANTVLGNYDAHGEIVRTDSRARTPTHPAEHLVVAVMPARGLMEAAFARFMLVEGKGVIVVFSHRAYGEHAADEVGAWLQAHGERTEGMLMGWNGLPKLAAVRALPQAK